MIALKYEEEDRHNFQLFVFVDSTANVVSSTKHQAHGVCGRRQLGKCGLIRACGV